MALQNKLREQMAQQFLDALNRGQLPWQACWQQDRPVNAVTGKQYRGVNALYLSYYADELGYTDPRWCTYKQAQDNGWQVQKGAKSCKVEYWAYYDAKQKKLLSWQEVRELLKADPEYHQNLQLRSRVYSVFNAAQIDGIPALERNQTSIGAIRTQRDTLIRNMGVGYQEQGSQAFYSPRRDTVTLPPEASFDDEYGYMATLLHECGHATGHPSRLNRELSGHFGTPSYAKEELRAEIASAFTAQALELRLTDAQLQYHMERHMAYVQSWADGLKDAPEELFRAIKDAEEISDYLIARGDFERLTDTPEAVYTHFYYRGDYLFTVTGAREGHAVYDRLCAAADDLGLPWESEGSAYQSDTLTAPASLLTPETAQPVGYTPYTEALLQEHIQQLEQQAEEAAEGYCQEEPGAQYRLFPAEDPQMEDMHLGDLQYTMMELPEGGLRMYILGDGAIPNYWSPAARPFQEHAAAIREVIIGVGVTEIGDRAFSNMPSLEKLTLPATVQRVGTLAVDNCPALQEIKFAGAEGLRDMRRCHRPSEILTLAREYPNLKREQLDEVLEGVHNDLTQEQLAVFARPEYSPIQMNSLRYAVERGLTPAQIQYMANPAFDTVQMDIIRVSFQCGMTMEQVGSFAKPEIPARQMLDAYWEIREGRDLPALEPQPETPANACIPELDYEP